SSAASSRAQLAVRARLVDRRRQMVGQKLEHLIGRHAEFRRQLLHALLAKRGAQLLGRHRQISAVAEPRLHLRAEAALLQLIDDALQVTEVGLLERFRDQGRRGGRRDIAQRAAQTVQQSHYLSSSLVMPLTDVSRSWRRACPALRRPARTCRRPAWCGRNRCDPRSGRSWSRCWPRRRGRADSATAPGSRRRTGWRPAACRRPAPRRWWPPALTARQPARSAAALPPPGFSTHAAGPARSSALPPGPTTAVS